jgi:hypothetical protein
MGYLALKIRRRIRWVDMPTFLLLLAWLSFLSGPASAQTPACDRFREALDLVPHTALEEREGLLEWMADGSMVTACEVRMETREDMLGGSSVPSFDPDPGTPLYDAGWRLAPEFLADGPGTGMHGMRRDDVLCLVSHEQPAYVDDDGTIVQSDTITVVVQCRQT